jgi:hypothetical protein
MTALNLNDFRYDDPHFVASGGYDNKPAPTVLDHYAWRWLGPEDNKDAVIFNLPIDTSVRPSRCDLRFLPKGRIFSLTAQGTMIPGVKDSDKKPVVTILIGSDSNSGDVIGVPGGDPAIHANAYAAIKDVAAAPFQSLAPGYVFETSEFDPADSIQLVPGTPLTSTTTDITDFDTAGLVKPGTPYVDHIIGVVIARPEMCGINHYIKTIQFQGCDLPRIPAGTISALRS